MRCPCQSCECDEGDYADKERHNPEKRSCTDVYCLVIFFLFMLGMMICAAVAGSVGDPRRLINGYDSWGNACAQSKNKKIDNVTLSGRNTDDTPKLFYYDWKDASVSRKPKEMKVCVSRCPENVTEGPTHNSTALEDLFNEGIKVCRYDVTLEEIQKKTYDKALCPKEISPHVSILNRCMPRTLVNVGRSIQSAVTNVVKKQAKKNQAYSSCNLKSSWIRKVANDYQQTWREMCIMGAVAVIFSFVTTVLMGYFACVLIWTMYALAVVMPVAASCYSWYKYATYKKELDVIPVDEQLDADKSLVHDWLVYSSVGTGFTVIILLVLLVLRTRLALVIQLFKEAGKAVRSMPLLFLQPVVTLGFLIAACVGIAFGAMFVFTAAFPLANPNNPEWVTYEPDEYIFYGRWYYLFGFLWVLQFVLACQQMVLAGSVAGYYFTRDKESLGWLNQHFIINSIKNLVVYHLGTVAVGSFIIALIQFIRIVLMYLQKKLKGYENKLVEYILKCLQCCFWCLEKILKYINRNAYIMTAVFGYNFCRAAHRAFTLLIGNILRVGAINSVGTFVLILGMFGVTAGSVLVGMIILKINHTICHFFIPLTTMGIFSFIIAYSFLSVYSMAIDTIFLCFCEDCEKNDGVVKPYFMSKELMSFVGKANEQMIVDNKKQKSEVSPPMD